MANENDLIEQIQKAFENVVLDDGIGLFEGNAIDDYADKMTRSKCREQDERLNWKAISVDALNQNHGCLSYLDTLGMRFLLPAFLVADLRGEMRMDPVFCLTQVADYKKFASFSPAQRLAVQSYLLFIRSDPNQRLAQPHIDLSLEAFWKV